MRCDPETHVRGTLFVARICAERQPTWRQGMFIRMCKLTFVQKEVRLPSLPSTSKTRPRKAQTPTEILHPETLDPLLGILKTPEP
eukprot:3420430-Rhodomonas_salina.1